MKTKIAALAGIILPLFFLIHCDKEDGNTPEPLIVNETTEHNADLTFTSILISGKVDANGGENITARGVCWSSNEDPSLNDNKTEETENSFTSSIETLEANTGYHFRIYASTDKDIFYGEDFQYITPSLAGTTWDLLCIHSTTVSWHADVTFYADGTTLYDEPADPGVFTKYGTWSLTGNELTYQMDTAITNAYIFTGTISKFAMAGTYTFGDDTKTWNAVKR